MNTYVMSDAAQRPNNLTAMTMAYMTNFFNEMGLGIADGPQIHDMTIAVMHTAMNIALKVSKSG